MGSSAENGWHAGAKRRGAAPLGGRLHRASASRPAGRAGAAGHAGPPAPRASCLVLPDPDAPGLCHRLTQFSSEARGRPAEDNADVPAGQENEPTPLPPSASPNRVAPGTSSGCWPRMSHSSERTDAMAGGLGACDSQPLTVPDENTGSHSRQWPEQSQQEEAGGIQARTTGVPESPPPSQAMCAPPQTTPLPKSGNQNR